MLRRVSSTASSSLTTIHYIQARSIAPLLGRQLSDFSQSTLLGLQQEESFNSDASPIDRHGNIQQQNIQRPSRWIPDQKLACVRFHHIESAVRNEIDRYLKETRIHLRTLPRFSRILNGLRPGELTVFTGPTGCGKTTVLSQISLDYCLQGLTVLWGSFEIRNSRLAQVMLQQIAMRPLIDEENVLDMKAYNDASSRLNDIEMHYMNLFGSHGLSTILDSMELSMKRGPKPDLIILDNLQFMLSGQSSSSLDKWDLMDRAISSIRAFCNTHDVHVMLVVHPRKEVDDTPLCLASVSGTAKATQEADNVIILQKLGEKRYLDVKKNRFYGDLGRVRIAFVPEARMVMEVNDEGVSEELDEAVNSGSGTQPNASSSSPNRSVGNERAAESVGEHNSDLRRTRQSFIDKVEE